MTRRFVLALAALLLAAPADAGSPPALPEFAVLDRLVPSDPLAERPTQWSNPAVSLTDVVYSVLPGYRPLRLDLYRPVTPGAPRPLIVFVHGGGWAHANPRVGAGFADFPAILGHLVQRGYVVAAIEYRFSHEAPFPAPVEDLQAALLYLQQNAQRFGIDGERVGLWGMSAGAQVAALVAADCKTGACVRAFAGWFGVYDLRPPHPQNQTLRDYLACQASACNPDVLVAASPIVHVKAGNPPTLLVQGDLDKNVSPTQARAFAAALREVGVSTDLAMLPGVGHGLIGPDSAATRDALREGLNATIDFFDRQLQSAPAAAAAAR